MQLTEFELSASQLELTTLSSDGFSAVFSGAFFNSTFVFLAAHRAPEFDGGTRRFLLPELPTGVTGEGVAQGLNGKHAATSRNMTSYIRVTNCQKWSSF